MQRLLGSLTNMAKDESVTFRLPADLKAELIKIAGETDRSLSNAVMWLLRRGIEAYQEDGVLVDTRPKVRRVPEVTDAIEVLKEQENRRV